MTIGGELQWGRRENFLDGFASDDVYIDMSWLKVASAVVLGVSANIAAKYTHRRVAEHAELTQES